MEITKYVLPVVVGAMSGMILITLGEHIIHRMYPMPAGTDLYNVDSLAAYVKTLPANAFAIMLLNYIICSFLAGVISTVIAKGATNTPAIVIGIVMTLAGLYYILHMPYPAWFTVVSMLTYMPFAYLGYLAARKKEAASGT